MQVRKCQNAVAFRKVLVANKEGVEEEKLMPCSPGEEGCIEMTIMDLASSQKYGVPMASPGLGGPHAASSPRVPVCPHLQWARFRASAARHSAAKTPCRLAMSVSQCLSRNVCVAMSVSP